MPGKVSRYSPKIDGELKMRVLAVLNEANDGVMPTLDWIKSQDMTLLPHSTQKLSRILSALIDMGLVRKDKSKSFGRMVYRLTSKITATEEETSLEAYQRNWAGMDWELEEERKYV